MARLRDGLKTPKTPRRLLYCDKPFPVLRSPFWDDDQSRCPEEDAKEVQKHFGTRLGDLDALSTGVKRGMATIPPCETSNSPTAASF